MSVQAVMLVYDLTNAASFENIEDWMDLVSTQFADSATKPHIALVGNKRDVSHLRVVRDLYLFLGLGFGGLMTYVARASGSQIDRIVPPPGKRRPAGREVPIWATVCTTLIARA